MDRKTIRARVEAFEELGEQVSRTPLMAHDFIEWVDFLPDGGEVPRMGRLWAPAPSFKGSGSWWVIPDCALDGGAPGGAGGVPEVCFVTRCTHRFLIGREWGGLWHVAGGRYVEKGELFREVDLRSRQAAHVASLLPAHELRLHAKPGAAAQGVLDGFAKLCEAAAAREVAA